VLLKEGLGLVVGDTDTRHHLANGVVDQQLVLNACKLLLEGGLTLKEVAGGVEQEQLLCDELLEDHRSALRAHICLSLLTHGRDHSVHVSRRDLLAANDGQYLIIFHCVNSFHGIRVFILYSIPQLRAGVNDFVFK
jgi:hypothetical protein